MIQKQGIRADHWHQGLRDPQFTGLTTNEAEEQSFAYTKRSLILKKTWLVNVYEIGI